MTSPIPLALAPELIGAVAILVVSVVGVVVAAIVLSKRTRAARAGTEQILAQTRKEAEGLVKEARVEAKEEAVSPDEHDKLKRQYAALDGLLSRLKGQSTFLQSQQSQSSQGS